MKITVMILLLLIAGIASGEGVDVHVVVWLEGIPELSAAEFRVDNLPIGPCSVEAEWNTDLIIGDVETGIALAFSPPLTGTTVHLGTLHITCFEPLDDEYQICVKESEEGGILAIVDGNYQTWDADGGGHLFNTDNPNYWCECYYRDKRDREWPFIFLFADPQFIYCYQDMPVDTTPTQADTWSRVKSLY